MNFLKKNPLIPFTLLILIVSGLYYILSNDNSPSEIEKELPHPEIIKGMKLGQDPEEQIKIAETNGICKDSRKAGQSFCCYEILPSIFAKPKFVHMLYNGEKVLSKVELAIFDPNTRITYQNLDGNLGIYMGLKKRQIDELIAKYEDKYGKGEEWDGEIYKGGGIDWHTDELLIRINYTEPSWGNKGQNLDNTPLVFPNDEYTVTIMYTYNSQYHKLLTAPDKEDTRFGEEGNQNI